MKVPKQYYDISERLASTITGCNTEEDDIKLKEWESLYAENKLLKEHLLSESNFDNNSKKLNKYSSDLAWKDIEIKIVKRNNLRFIFKEIFKYAAILILIISLVGFLYWYQSGRVVVETLTINNDIAPGGKGAQLILADGKTINLFDKKDFTIKESDGSVIKKGQKSINYSKSESTSDKVIYNTMKTLKGMEYPLTLSDGTKVFLNAESKIKYPVAFKGNLREVEISGEVYFDVAKDKSKPFIVRTGNMSLEVLGTSFNVKAYNDEKEIATTLVDGKVKVMAKGKNVILTPGEQAVFTNNSLSVKEVDVSLHTSWTKGKFIFRNERIEDIMKSLKRWYDFEVYYHDEEAKNIRLGSSFNRYEDINPVIEMMKKTDLFIIKQKGKIIYIASK